MLLLPSNYSKYPGKMAIWIELRGQKGSLCSALVLWLSLEVLAPF